MIVWYFHYKRWWVCNKPWELVGDMVFLECWIQAEWWSYVFFDTVPGHSSYIILCKLNKLTCMQYNNALDGCIQVALPFYLYALFCSSLIWVLSIFPSKEWTPLMVQCHRYKYTVTFMFTSDVHRCTDHTHNCWHHQCCYCTDSSIHCVISI